MWLIYNPHDVDVALQVQLAGVHDQNVVEEIWWPRLSWTFLQQTPHGEDALPGKPPGFTFINNIFSSTVCNQDFLVDAPDDINIEAGSSKYRHQNKKDGFTNLSKTLYHTWAGQQNWLVLWSRAMLSFSRRWWLSTEGQGWLWYWPFLDLTSIKFFQVLDKVKTLPEEMLQRFINEARWYDSHLSHLYSVKKLLLMVGNNNFVHIF